MEAVAFALPPAPKFGVTTHVPDPYARYTGVTVSPAPECAMATTVTFPA